MLTLSLLAATFDNICKQLGPRLVLILTETVRYSDSFPKSLFFPFFLKKKKEMVSIRQQKHEKIPSYAKS